MTSPTGTELNSLFEGLFNANSKASVLSIVPQYSDSFVPKELSSDYPVILSNLKKESYVDLPKEDLLEVCVDIGNNISVTEKQSKNVESITKKQSKSKQWFRFRTGRITASVMKDVCRTSVDKPAQSLIKKICYPLKSQFKSKPTQWGLDNEKLAKEYYVKEQLSDHSNFIATESGLVISTKYPFLAATPDGFVECSCCGKGVLEVKCLYTLRSENLFDHLDKIDCIERVDDELELKVDDKFMYQVQTQMAVCSVSYCDLVLWTPKSMFINRVSADPEIAKEIVLKSENFFYACVLPELVGKLYSRPQPEVTSVLNVVFETELPSSPTASSQTRDELFCVCQKPFDEMLDYIGCDNESCVYKWWHFSCANISHVPEGDWVCPLCISI